MDEKEISLSSKLDKTSKTLIGITILILLFGFISPYIFTRKSLFTILDFTETGQIGDTIGGIMNPFISICAVITSFLAFYMQVRANQLQVILFKEQLRETEKQFKEDQEESKKERDLHLFESQFYEMLRLHKENVNEIEIRSDNGDLIKGRAAFYEMKKEFETIFCFCIENKEKIERAYELFFWGFCNEIEYHTPQETQRAIMNMTDTPSFEGKLLEFKESEKNWVSFSESETLKYNLNIPLLKGHHGYLGHYYRHLFYTVKFVVNTTFLDDKQKLNYLKLLRVQLSNYEQIMLFYNWLGGYGTAWENEKNHFFTKYKMIHNLWHSVLLKNDYIKKGLEYLVDTYYNILKPEGDLFEIEYILK